MNGGVTWIQVIDALAFALSDTPPAVHDYVIAKMAGGVTKMVADLLPDYDQVAVANQVALILLATKMKLKAMPAANDNAADRGPS